jgi:hypothetical protein
LINENVLWHFFSVEIEDPGRYILVAESCHGKVDAEIGKDQVYTLI